MTRLTKIKADAILTRPLKGKMGLAGHSFKHIRRGPDVPITSKKALERLGLDGHSLKRI